MTDDKDLKSVLDTLIAMTNEKLDHNNVEDVEDVEVLEEEDEVYEEEDEGELKGEVFNPTPNPILPSPAPMPTNTPKLTLFDRELTNVENEVLTLEEAMTKAGANFEVDKCQVTANRPAEFGDTIMPNLCATFRKDTGDILSDKGVSSIYGIVQFVDAVNFVDVLVSEGAASIKALGAPGKGRHLYLVLRANGTLNIGSKAIENLFLITTSHDGLAKLDIRITPVIDNVIMMPYSSGISFRHSKKVADRMNAAHRTAKTVTKQWEKFTEETKKLMETKVTTVQAEEYFAQLLDFDTQDKDPDSRKLAIFSMVCDIYNKGLASKLPGIHGTMFGAYLAFSEYIGVQKKVKRSKYRSGGEAELFSKLHGPNVLHHAKAFAFATHLSTRLAGI